MSQIIQYQKSGEIFIEELPPPKLKNGGVLVQNIYSLISAGTERTLVETAQAPKLGKVKSHPDLVKRDDIISTHEKVFQIIDVIDHSPRLEKVFQNILNEKRIQIC